MPEKRNLMSRRESKKSISVPENPGSPTPPFVDILDGLHKVVSEEALEKKGWVSKAIEFPSTKPQ